MMEQKEYDIVNNLYAIGGGLDKYNLFNKKFSYLSEEKYYRSPESQLEDSHWVIL